MFDTTDIQAHRKARLRELIDSAFGGKISRFAEKMDRTESYVGRMLYPVDKAQQRPVSDKMSLWFEARCGLPRGWFDLPTGAALPGATTSDATAVAPMLQTGDDRSRASAVFTWPFYRSQYQRIAALRAAMDSDWPEARDDMDAHLELLIERWEREALRRNAAKNNQTA